MKGFVRKDLSILLGMYKKNLLFIFLLYAVLVLVTQTNFFIYFTILMVGFYSISSLTMDQSCSWDRYARTLPVSTKQIMAGKFVVTLLFIAAATIYGLVLSALNTWIHGIAFGPMLPPLFAFCAISLMCMGILLPCSLKWGVDKARNSLVLICLLLYVIPALFGDRLAAYFPMDTLLVFVQGNLLWIVVALFVASVMVYLIGYGLSCRIYAKKEF